MIAIVVVSHGELAEGFVQSAYMIFGEQEKVKAVTFKPGETKEDLTNKLKTTVESFDLDDQILFMVDLFGGTPFNAASTLATAQPGKTALVAGVNLPMLLESFSQRNKPLDEVVTRLEETAKAGVKHLDLSLDK